MLVSVTYLPPPVVYSLIQNKGLHRIDLHHHFFPSSLDKAKRNIEVGWRTPDGNLPWDPAISLASMDALGIETAILSLPPDPSGIICSENRDVARAHNRFAAKICQEYPGRFGFFAGLPFLDDVAGRYFPKMYKMYAGEI
jgi:6-methylsalicylate decarboxylase